MTCFILLYERGFSLHGLQLNKQLGASCDATIPCNLLLFTALALSDIPTLAITLKFFMGPGVGSCEGLQGSFWLHNFVQLLLLNCDVVGRDLFGVWEYCVIFHPGTKWGCLHNCLYWSLLEAARDSICLPSRDLFRNLLSLI